MNVLDIFYLKYFVEDGSKVAVGGIESYITQLSILAKSIGIKTRIFQFALDEWVKELDYATVYSVKSGSSINALYDKAFSLRNLTDNYLSIIANDTIIPNKRIKNSIVIQHGIGFDSILNSHYPLLIGIARRFISSCIRIKKLQKVDSVICVDNNYICWYRTQTPRRDIEMIPILNYAEFLDEQIVKSSNPIKIVFARRFVEVRGTKLFAPVAKRILQEFSNVEITFAGNGPDKDYLKNYFENNDRVSFTEYKSQDSLSFHKQFNIAVVPTIYSEGTSLSLLEAMSAQCAVVCTNVGGMTNIILDEYNGLMVSPKEDELLSAVRRLVSDEELRIRLSKNASQTIKYTFSLEKWSIKWKEVLESKFSSMK